MVFDLPSVIKAYYSCRSGKRNCQYALEFEYNLETYLYKLSQDLINRQYEIGQSSCFVITYPTVREIFAASFRDRVVHHLLINYIEEGLDKRFIFDSLACRKTKGAVFGIKRLRRFLYEVTHNRTRNAYYLKLDIQSFFYSMDKDILLDILVKGIYKLKFNRKDTDDLIWLSSKIIAHNPCDNYYKKSSLELLKSLPKDKSLFTTCENKGLAIGNLTSQFFANLYLNEVDQYIKRVLKVKYYLRYADDMLFIADSMEKLKDIELKVTDFLRKELGLEIKRNKTKYGSVYQGIDFVGYITKPDYVLTRNRVVNNLKKKLYYFNRGYLIDRKLCMEEIVALSDPVSAKEIEAICASINSVFGHLKWSNSYFLKQSIYNKHMGVVNNYLEPRGNLESFRPCKPSR